MMNSEARNKPLRLSRRKLLKAAGTVAGAAAVSSLAMPAIAQKVTITYWSPLDPTANNPRSQGEAAMLDIFRKAHPDIEVRVEPVPWQVMGQQVIQSVLSGGGPDVSQLSTTNLPDQIAAGTGTPLDDYVGKGWTQEERDDFILPWDNTVYDGQKMAYYWSSFVGNQFWYLREDVEGEPPQNWNDLPAYLKPAAERTGKPGFLVGLSQQGNAVELTNWLIPTLWACGAEYVNDDGSLGFNNENGAKPFEWLLAMVREHKLTPESIVSLTRDNTLDAIKGRVAISTVLSSNVVSPARAAVGDSLQLAYTPGPDGPIPVFAGGKFLLMSKTSKQKEAAGLFIESLISYEAQLVNAQLAREIPVRRSVTDDPWFQTADAADIKFSLDYMADHPRLFRYPQRTDFLQTRIALAAQQMVAGRPVREQLDLVAQEWDAARRS